VTSNPFVPTTRYALGASKITTTATKQGEVEAQPLPKRARMEEDTDPAANLPAPPYTLNGGSPVHLPLGPLCDSLASEEKLREASAELSNELSAVVARARGSAGGWAEGAAVGSESAFDEMDTLMRRCANLEVGADGRPARRRGGINWRMEECVRALVFRGFIATGKFPALDPVLVRDEEYLLGTFGAAQDLVGYAMGRAVALDFASVSMARDAVNDVLAVMLEFDLRNGPVRKRYDGLKYALKRLETISYELSSVRGPTDAVRSVVSRIHAPSFDAVRVRMEEFDAKRESIIKRTRDAQKAAKHAIFALHRNDPTAASSKLEHCRALLHDELFPAAASDPALRYGALAAAAEEYAEAALFFTWTAEGRLAPPSEMPSLTPEEYLGGLCDLTGEIGRVAVARGTARDDEGVGACLRANVAVLGAIEGIEYFPQRKFKGKADAVRQSVQKLQHMLYEMALSRAGRVGSVLEVQLPPPESKPEANEN